MKVLQILDTLSRGGAQMLALDLCRNARANGLDLTFVATGGGDLEDEFRRADVEFIRLQRKMPVDPELVRKLRQIILDRKAQVVHSHQPVEALHAYLAVGKKGVKQVLTLHGYVGDLKNRLTLRFLLPRMSANIAVSQHFLERLSAEEGFDTGRNFHVIRNGVDARRIESNGGGVRAELGLTKGHILLGMVGNFHFGVKDQMTICRALPQLLRQAPRLHFVFAGGRSAAAPHLYDDCVRYCSEQNIIDRVHFLGQRSDVADVLNSLDAFVFSSLKEGLPIAVIEAMMMGLPTIVSDIGPLLEVSGNGSYALVFRRQDPLDLVEKLTPLVTAPGQFARLGAEAKVWARGQFSIEGHICELRGLYKALAFQA